MNSETGSIFQGLDCKSIAMLKSVAEKYKKFSSLSDTDKKYFKDIYWESHNIKRNFIKFKEYFDYLSIKFEEQENLYKQEMEVIRSNYKNNEPQPVTLEWLKVSVGLDRFAIDYRQIFFSSLLISIVSFIEDMIVAFSKKYFSDYIKPTHGIIQNTLCFLKEKKVTNSKRIFKDIVAIRNDFVHNNATIVNSKDVILKVYYIEKDSITSKLVLSKKFIHNLIVESEFLFNHLYKTLYEIKELEVEQKAP